MVRSIFSQPTSAGFKLWNNFVALFIFVSCVILALDTVQEIFDEYGHVFKVIEWISVGVFTLDYIGNILFSEKKIKYALRCGASLIWFPSCPVT